MIDISSRPHPSVGALPRAGYPAAVETAGRFDDRELIATIRRRPPGEAEDLLGILFRRYQDKVARWCRRYCGDADTAADLAQEVFLRVHQRLHTFKLQSSFSTWLYTVTRRVAINRTRAERLRRAAVSLDEESFPEPADPAPDAAARAADRQISRQLRRALERDLEPREARVLYLHFVDGMTLPAITELLGLENKSGAKAYVVSGKRKLQRGFGPWLRSQAASAPGVAGVGGILGDELSPA